MELIHFNDLLKKVSTYYKVKPEDLLGKVRKAEFTTPRNVLIKILHNKGWSLTKIGKRLNRDHTTILHSLKKINSSPAALLDVKNLETFIKNIKTIDLKLIPKYEKKVFILNLISELSGIKVSDIKKPPLEKTKTLIWARRITARVLKLIGFNILEIGNILNIPEIKEVKNLVISSVREETSFIKQLLKELNIDTEVEKNLMEKKILNYKTGKIEIILEEVKPCPLTSRAKQN